MVNVYAPFAHYIGSVNKENEKDYCETCLIIYLIKLDMFRHCKSEFM